MSQSAEKINIDEPRWNQNTFYGRFRHFAAICDTRNAFASNKDLYGARELVDSYRNGIMTSASADQLYRSKILSDSAFHPDSGQLMSVLGRMSFAVPSGIFVTAAMMTWYRSNTALIFWQWLNQSYMACLNYTNRNAQSSISTKTLVTAYVSATTSAVAVSLGLKSLLAKRAGSLAQRFVPFCAVAAANCVNVPLMRQSELTNGIMLTDENNRNLVPSKLAAAKAVSLVVVSRLIMAAPAMLIGPILMDRLEARPWYKLRAKYLNAPVQGVIVGAFLLFMIPTGCALFPQKNSIALSSLERFEPRTYNALQQTEGHSAKRIVYFNKGL